MLKWIVIFIFIGVQFVSVIALYNFQTQNRRSTKDLPVKEDLDRFLKPIESLTNYITNNITRIEIDYALGIFFSNVHLGRILMDKGKNIPDQLLSRINAIVDTNEKSLSYFHRVTKIEIKFWNNTQQRNRAIISDLFVNSTYWALRLKKMKYEIEPTYTYSDLEDMYSKWTNYKINVNKFYNWNPNPKTSDVCLVTLAINPSFKENSTSCCPIAKTCYNMLTQGTNFGYALCHRLLLLLMAQLGRGCFILSGLEDEELMQKFCSMAYAEAEYIAMNGYGIVDLMLEIMCLCSMDGRVQFLRRTWLNKMFDFQNTNGCFGAGNNVKSHIRRTQSTECNSHTTSLASSTYAAAVRFILEEYY